ncbi:unnamed protein product (macronuclear) [Paramecium tetraurelia]|uniref:H-type lectin domain-containing protein n=1 Tax=Paramecium tetraurelia TaxID=5888 RepID=A0C7A0_PARTE|nr:uncharacterized protein GSPATT00035797001 [Paramecium tetraurelia]CAK66667.1 unnamed protein product [Paramecium tetraurelia]|eukprot:XP_001434064.1 hypothetical protein (macronuclear) [Paramecium tetraurelia strain d4-2]
MIYLTSLYLLNSVLGQLTYDSGLFSGFSSSCANGRIETKTISFHGIFDNIPQVILGLEHLDMYFGADFRIQTQNIKKNSFDLQIECLTSTTLWTIKYYWYAIDDSRIQVINNFNMVNVNDKTFDHLNPNANYGILSFISMGVTGNVDFKLSITSITPSQVSVGITKVAGKFTNLNQIGYQIILGIQEAFYDTKILKHTSDYDSGTVTQQQDRWLFLAYNGLQLSSSFRQKSIRTQVSKSYTVETWYGTYVVNYHLSSWVAYQYTTEFKAFLCFTLRISQSLDMEVSQKPSIFVEISELNQSFQSSSYLLLEKTVSLLSFKIYMKCVKTKTIVSQFLKCQNCSTSNKFYLFSHYCHGQIDAVTYFPKFQLIESSYKELNINFLVDRLTITQTLFNQIQSIETLVEIKFKV